ncbi:hypothetical protein EV426DRAFT_610531 [Tirmania nivea]|nr:hypothetical protein EV426DRAFT_610531 [Tirmania nivea]
MGMASKLAAASAAQQHPPAQGAPPVPYGQSPAPGQQYPVYGQQPPQSYGQGPPRQPVGDAKTFYHILKECVEENHINQLYPDDRIMAIAKRLSICGKDPVGTLCQRWGVPLEIGFDFVKQALYDVVFLLDDSGSIRFSELEGELKGILQAAAFATSLFDEDGFSVRFFNSDVQGDHVKSEQEAMALVDRVAFNGETPLAGSLKNKILKPMVEHGRLDKPLHVIIITDGVPTDSVRGEFQRYIKETLDRFVIGGVRSKVVSIQIAQIGNDKKAQAYLHKIDTDPDIGSLIDCTSNFELESTQYAKKGLTITKFNWYCKLMMGAIDKSYDDKDEEGATGASKPPAQYPAQGAPPQQYGAPGQYGGPQPPYGGPGSPPPQQYGGPVPQYGVPPQGYGAPQLQGYGLPVGYPPQGQYSPYGVPPPQQHGQQGYPQQPPQSYGGYPQQGQYPPYGGPQPPPPQKQGQRQHSQGGQPDVYTGQAPPAQYNPGNQYPPGHQPK